MERIEKKERVLTSYNMRYSLDFICDEYILSASEEQINVSNELYKKIVSYIKREYNIISKELIEVVNKKTIIKETTKENTNWILQLEYRI